MLPDCMASNTCAASRRSKLSAEVLSRRPKSCRFRLHGIASSPLPERSSFRMWTKTANPNAITGKFIFCWTRWFRRKLPARRGKRQSTFQRSLTRAESTQPAFIWDGARWTNSTPNSFSAGRWSKSGPGSNVGAKKMSKDAETTLLAECHTAKAPASPDKQFQYLKVHVGSVRCAPFVSSFFPANLGELFALFTVIRSFSLNVSC